MRKFLPLLVLVVVGTSILPTSLFSQNTQVLRPLFIPTNYYIGDRVELRVFLGPEGANRIVPGAPLPDLPPMDWGIVHEVRTMRVSEGIELRLLFTPLLPGTHTLPSFSVGDLPLGEVQVFVNSVIPEGVREPVGLMPQRVLPGTIMYLVLQFLVLLGIGVLAFFAIRFGLPLVIAAYERYKAGLPLRKFYRGFHGIINNKHLKPQELMQGIGNEFRQYLARRTGFRAESLTGRELAFILDELGMHQDLVNQVRAAFIQSDAILFGGEFADEMVVRSHALVLEGAVREVEETLLVRKDVVDVRH